MNSAGQIKLVDKDGREIELTTTPFTIGSFKNICSYWIDDKSVSPIHCQIEEKDGALTIQDLNSKLGVLVNGVAVEPEENHPLKNEDIIQIGEIKLTVKMTDELLSEAEYIDLNDNFKRILADPVNELRVAEDTIGLLLQKVLEVNQIAFGDNMETLQTSIEQIIPGLKTSADLPQSNFDFSQTMEDDDSISISEMMIKEREKQLDNINANPFAEENNSSSRMVDVDPAIFQNGAFAQPNEEPKSEPIQVKPKKSTLVLREINKPYTEIKISDTPFKIGRSSELCNFILDRRGVSRSHATVMRDERSRAFLIRDNNAVNGTYVNGRQLIGNEAALRVGDTVQFYDYEFKVIEIS